MVLVAGSYERFIWGFSLKTLNPNLDGNGDGNPNPNGNGNGGYLKPLFSYPSHTGPIKCAAVCGPVAVSGGADDTVKIYDLAARSELGSVTDFSGGAVTALAFHAAPAAVSVPLNLVAGSDAGAVSVYDADPFVLLKTVPRVFRRAAAVADLAVHVSGRLALAVARGDAALAMINLVRGRRSFVGRLPAEASLVRFAAGGDRFFLVSGDRLSIHAADDAREESSVFAEKKILCIAPTKEKMVVTGDEGGDVTAWDMEAGGKTAFCIRTAHSARVKGVVAMNGGTNLIVASAASDGVIRAWDTRMVTGTGTSPYLAEARTKSRLTCLAGPVFKL